MHTVLYGFHYDSVIQLVGCLGNVQALFKLVYIIDTSIYTVANRVGSTEHTSCSAIELIV